MSADNSKRNVRSLMSRIRAYERLFKEKDKEEKEKKKKDNGNNDSSISSNKKEEPDNQAHSAYMNLIKLVHALEKDNPKEDTGVHEKLTQERVREVLRDVYGI